MVRKETNVDWLVCWQTFSNPKEALRRFLQVNMDDNSINQSSALTTTNTASYFSLVITDIWMLGLNGIQTISNIEGFISKSKDTLYICS
jgi:hypothetical protein